MTGEYVPQNVGEFNQAQLIQIRLQDLLSRVNTLSVNPLIKNYELGGIYNYEIIFNDLNTVINTIWSKLNRKEREYIVKFKEMMRNCFLDLPIFVKIIDESSPSKTQNKLNITNWNFISDLLFKYRNDIEQMMDDHGYGNPNKRDPRRAGMMTS